MAGYLFFVVLEAYLMHFETFTTGSNQDSDIKKRGLCYHVKNTIFLWIYKSINCVKCCTVHWNIGLELARNPNLGGKIDFFFALLTLT